MSGSRISGMQCQFILNETTHEIILRDRSAYQSTLLTNGLSSKQLLRGVPRQRVIRRPDNLTIGMGGVNGDLVKFDLAWAPLDDEARFNAAQVVQEFVELPQNPRFAITRNDRDTESDRYEMRMQTPWDSTRLTHRKLKQLGQGSFDTVYQTVDLHTGDHLAVKIIRTDTAQRHTAYWKAAFRREADCCMPFLIRILPSSDTVRASG